MERRKSREEVKPVNVKNLRNAVSAFMEQLANSEQERKAYYLFVNRNGYLIEYESSKVLSQIGDEIIYAIDIREQLAEIKEQITDWPEECQLKYGHLPAYPPIKIYLEQWEQIHDETYFNKFIISKGKEECK
jgi:hypothetical protein